SRQATATPCRQCARVHRGALCGCHGCAPPAAARAQSSSAHRAARRGRARPHTTRPELPFFATFAPFNAKLDRHDALSSRMHSLDEFPTAKLGELQRASLRRALIDTTRTPGTWVLPNGRRLRSFCCNDYLNLTHHPVIKEAAIAALRTYGVGAGASRLVSGNHPLLGELEARLARLKETEAACVFGSGYLANVGIIPALIGPGDLILIDELAHACLWAGARLARAAVMPFRRGDVRHLDALLTDLRQRHGRALIATDGVFSMDGDIAPLRALGA